MRTLSLSLSLAPMALLWSQGAFAAPPEWQVSEVTGNVRLTHEGETRAATRGAILAPGDIVATAPGARAVIVRGQEYVIVSANTQLRLPVAARSGGVTQMIEDFGNAVYRITKKATPHFGVETPYLAAVVKGTTFSVTVGPEGASVQVIEGAVEVTTNDGGASELIEPGVIALVGASDRYRLTVEGADSRVIDSPARPAQSDAVEPPADGPEEPASPAPADSQLISTPIAEEGPALTALTGGLVQGDAGIELALAAVSASRAEATSEAPVPAERPGGGGDSAPGNDGNGNGNGNGNDNGNGNGNDNGNGNGNGNGGGNADPGGDNGDSGPGNNNGGGNSAPDDGDNAGPGNGNGNSGDSSGPGNGDGNSGSDDDNSGPGNSDGNGNSGSDDGDNSGSGDSNGNGNSEDGDNSGPGNNNGNGNSGSDGSDNSGPGNGNANSESDDGDNSGPGNGNGNGNGNSGSDGDNSGPGNGNGNSGSDDSDNSGPGNNNGNGNSGSDDNDNSGSGNRNDKGDKTALGSGAISDELDAMLDEARFEPIDEPSTQGKRSPVADILADSMDGLRGKADQR